MWISTGYYITGGDVNVSISGLENRTLCIWQPKSGNIKLVNLLLEDGADLNAQEGRIGATPLHTAVQGGHLEVIDRLLAHPEIDPNIRLNNGSDSGYSAIHIAVLQEHQRLQTADRG